MQHSPPPLFKQGAPARVKVLVFSILAVALLISDARFSTLRVVRQVVGTALYPLQRAALAPRDALLGVADYFSSQSALESEIKELKRQQVANALTLQQAQQLAEDNAQLRRLLDSRERMQFKSLLGEILYDTRDAFTRKIVLDRGLRDGVKPGQPVIDDLGVVGQVTRVFPFTAEVTLLTDKDQAIPVQLMRNGLRSVAYGRGQPGGLDLRFMPANADVKVGDVLVTSGIDGVYPPGLAVAKVAQVENNSSGAFGRIVCQPMAGVEHNRQLLIVMSEMNIPPRPEPEAPPTKAKKKAKDAKGKDAKDAKKEGAEGKEDAATKESTGDAAKAGTKPDAKPDAKATEKPAAGVTKEADKPAAKPPAAVTKEAEKPAKPPAAVTKEADKPMKSAGSTT